MSPTDAQLALCSSGAYGEKEGEGPDKGTLPAQIELEKLSKRWNVPTGLHTATASDHKAPPPLDLVMIGLVYKATPMVASNSC